ncbi:MAG: isoaspartyl peptidase/L-asparaginase, partial [Terriglobia bacterium]
MTTARLTRRKFFHGLAALGAVVAVDVGGVSGTRASSSGSESERTTVRPLIVSTWRQGKPANEKAAAVLAAGGSLLDAVEQGINLAELDAEIMSVGYGAIPNEEGVLQLDAAIMDGATHRAGAVAALE